MPVGREISGVVLEGEWVSVPREGGGSRDSPQSPELSLESFLELWLPWLLSQCWYHSPELESPAWLSDTPCVFCMELLVPKFGNSTFGLGIKNQSIIIINRIMFLHKKCVSLVL